MPELARFDVIVGVLLVTVLAVNGIRAIEEPLFSLQEHYTQVVT